MHHCSIVWHIITCHWNELFAHQFNIYGSIVVNGHTLFSICKSWRTWCTEHAKFSLVWAPFSCMKLRSNSCRFHCVSTTDAATERNAMELLEVHASQDIGIFPSMVFIVCLVSITFRSLSKLTCRYFLKSLHARSASFMIFSSICVQCMSDCERRAEQSENVLEELIINLCEWLTRSHHPFGNASI